MNFWKCPVCKKEAIYAEFDFKKNGCKFVCRECGYETRMYYSNKSAADAFDCARNEVHRSYVKEREQHE